MSNKKVQRIIIFVMLFSMLAMTIASGMSALF